MRWVRYGRNGVLITFADKSDRWAHHKCLAMVETLTRKPPARLVEFVPGYTTMLLEFDLSENAQIEPLAQEAIDLLSGSLSNEPSESPLKTIPVKYNGCDLERVAAHNRISVDQVIAFHSAPIYSVYLLGFSPGFPYLGNLHHRLHTPRLPSPRTKVPAGSVAIGGTHTGIYTVESPGGWNIIGHTETTIFDPSKANGEEPEKAFHLKPGDRVRFFPIK